MDPVTMMVASIGMQFFNNYANNKKNKEIQAQQREFQKAAAVHDFDRMRKAQATAAKLALELEEEVHKERVEDIEKSYDTLLENLAHSFAISNWPLNVLPFIMKGESFGSLFGGTSKSISMHCILTPSNCQWFNEYFYDDLDLRVEAEMNNNWNAQSTHPVVYYGGGWNRRQTKPNGTSIPSLIDLDDIALLKNKLKQIPTMIITPYFDPYLYFRVQLWGMGKDSNIPFRIDIPYGEIKSNQRIFSYDYNKDCQQELTDDFFNSTMEEFVPYLTCLIGFVADKYFWSIYGIKPQLPELIKSLRYIENMGKSVHKNYTNLLKSAISHNKEVADGIVLSKENLISLYQGIKPILQNNERSIYINQIVCEAAEELGIDDLSQCDNLDGYFQQKDVSYLNDVLCEIHDEKIRDKLSIVYNNLKSQISCSSIENDVLTFLDVLDYGRNLLEDSPSYREVKIEIHEEFVLVALLNDDGETIVNDIDNPKCLILFYKNFIIADRIQLKSSSFKIAKANIDSLYNKVKQLY